MKKIFILITVFLISISTTFAASDVDSIQAEALTSSAVISWLIADDTAISKIEVLIKEDNSGANFRKYKLLDKSARNIEVPKLEPLGSYTFKVKLNFENGQKSKGKETTVIIKHKNVVWDELDGKKFFVYLPDGYEKKDATYPVMYMFDGQNLFTTAFTPSKWGIDDTLDELTKADKVEKMIVVGVFHAGDKRAEEYIPYFYDMAKNYSEWFVKKLIPYIDSKYATKSDRANRGIMGSSLGGLMTLYMVNNYPESFSFGGAVSTHNPWEYKNIKDIPKRDIKLWLDAGTGEYSGGKMPDGSIQPYCYAEAARVITDGYISKGQIYGKDLFYYEVKDAIHNEMDWAKRVAVPFLLFKGKHEGKIKDFSLAVEAVRIGDGSIKYLVNPVGEFDNGVIYSLYKTASYTISGSGKIDDSGIFTLGNDKEAEITVKFENIEKKIKVTTEDMEKEVKKINK